MNTPKLKRWIMMCSTMMLATSATTLYARLPADQLARLGKDLTPMGAEKAGNKEGSIPAWTGGLTKPPAGFDPAKGYANPFAAEQPLYTITAANIEQYKNKLPAGSVMLFKRQPSYKMFVYPTHRTAGYPDAVYETTMKEAAQAELTNDGASVAGALKTSVPFPIPANGAEAIWNHTFRYRGGMVKRDVTEFPVNRDGSFTPVKTTEKIIFAQGLSNAPENYRLQYLTYYTAPSNLAGEATLVNEYADMVKQPRKAWIYNPGTRRVMRAPEISYDSPREGTDGLSTTDDYDGFNGQPDRFSWKLLGKREMIIPYNSYKLTDKSLKYKDIIKPGILNQDLVRYELHRVWVVEGTLKPNKSHIYGKRVYLLDEDSWQIVHSDAYDGRGELWRVLEMFGVQYYDAAVFWTTGSVQYDLQARRYVSSGLSNEEKPWQFNASFKISDFTSGALSRIGN